jgi:anti-sigma regulatory factor (Ser/Thr protein kinase)
MKTRIIKTPESDGLELWINFINNELNLININENIIIDFGILKFIDTNSLVMLACLLEELIQLQCNISFTGGQKALNQHLTNIRFYEQWLVDNDRNLFKHSKNNTTLCLWKINKNSFSNYSQHAQEYFKRSFANNIDLSSLSSNLDEVFNNIFDHSKSKNDGYVISQFYPKNNNISFSVCDFGIGIAKSLNDYRVSNNNTKLEDSEAIFEATRLGSSAKSTPRNRGFGLDNIKSFVKSGNGMLNIISNKGQLKIENSSITFFPISTEFKGTLITVRIDLKVFDEDDLEEMTLF